MRGEEVQDIILQLVPVRRRENQFDVVVVLHQIAERPDCATALEVASKGITVNAICPGWVDTEMTARSVARIVRTSGRAASEARSALEAMNPQRRLIQPEEVADLAVWFAGDEAAGVTGQAYNVADGKGST